MDFQLIYANLNIPVMVVDFPDKHIIYMNSQAKIMLDIDESDEPGMIYDALKCKDPDTIRLLLEAVNENETIQNFLLQTEDDVILDITGNIISAGVLILYIREVTESERNGSYNTVFRNVFSTAFSLQDIGEILNLILKAAGLSAHVSCSFIFEEKGPSGIECAYEWRSSKMRSALGCKDIDFVNSSFMRLLKSNDSVVINDIREIDPCDAKMFSNVSVKAIALFPLVVSGKYYGFIGFADFQTPRKWTNNDLLIFLDTTNLVSEVFARSQMEQLLAESQKIISNVLDNISTNIYVADYNTNELLFINKHFIKELGITGSFEGKKCWELLHKNMTEQCGFCEKHLLFDADGNYIGTRKKESMNEITGKWYYAENSIIKWIDGRTAFLETGIEFGERKALEEELRYYASIDVMTQTYNRAWGLKLLHEIIDSYQLENYPVTACFIDVDGLKFVNDKYGHSEGDELLTTIVCAIKNNISEQDILARLGGDEFLIVFKSSAYEQADKKLQDIINELKIFNSTGIKPYNCLFCYGLYQVEPNDGLDVDEIISLVDAKMYEQKVLRRNAIYVETNNGLQET